MTEFLVIVALVIVTSAVMALWYRVRRAITTSQRREARAAGPPGVWAPSSADRALRYPGPPFDHMGMRQVSGVEHRTVRRLPVTTFTYRHLGDRNPAMADISWFSYFVIALGLPARLPTLKVTTTAMFHTSKYDGPLARVLTGDDHFDEYYAAYSDNPAFVADALGPELRQWILQAEAKSWLIQDNEIVAWSRDYHEDDIDVVVQFLMSVVGRIPDVVWQRVGVDPRTVHRRRLAPWRYGDPNGEPKWALPKRRRR